MEVTKALCLLKQIANLDFKILLLCAYGPCRVDGIATGYRLDGPGVESRWVRDFLHLSRPALGSTQLPVQ